MITVYGFRHILKTFLSFLCYLGDTFRVFSILGKGTDSLSPFGSNFEIFFNFCSYYLHIILTFTVDNICYCNMLKKCKNLTPPITPTISSRWKYPLTVYLLQTGEQSEIKSCFYSVMLRRKIKWPPAHSALSFTCQTSLSWGKLTVTIQSRCKALLKTFSNHR